MYHSLRRSPLVRIAENLNEFKYIDFLTLYILPFKSIYYASDSKLTFQNDGCRLHRANVVAEFLVANNVNVPPWPAQSPDLNAI